MHKEEMSIPELYRWIIGALLVSLSAILWWILLDVKQQGVDLQATVMINSNRITDIERRVSTFELAALELKDELKTHRVVTEPSTYHNDKPR